MTDLRTHPYGTCCDSAISQIQDRLHCAKCGKTYGPVAGGIVRPTGQDSSFLSDAIERAQADAGGYREKIESRLVAGELEYGTLQYLKADCDHEAEEEALDIGGWLLLSDHQLELAEKNGDVDPLVAARARHLRVTAAAHAIRAFAAIRTARQVLREPSESATAS